MSATTATNLSATELAKAIKTETKDLCLDAAGALEESLGIITPIDPGS